jgi:hypothetical protein
MLPLSKRRHVGAVQSRSRSDSLNFSVFSQPARRGGSLVGKILSCRWSNPSRFGVEDFVKQIRGR